ncbi:aminoacyl-tRNA hydrolase [Marinigracilibium pacificum]|uniref:Peptidyl-tRNA hydrolase n=1 Tax=Marinigracilibium pacificum TaxID=2729599 RepID=A0A848IXR5_9BACT|nr:aminoacyl-tRNA hydrolase [Marinigracilibium pacificum]NMM49087.1 aminoacyl-tRNA hydrolase [Marinigracilibium pacificum]
MKYLIVGLGNIGAEYEQTRHNIGFMVADELAKKFNVTFALDKQSYKAEFKHKGRTFFVIKPTTYMNLSGKAVKHWMQKENIPISNILVIVDDLALPFGTLRMRGKGSAAGHNGLKNIEQLCGGSNYPRLRFGIGDDFPKGRQIDFVLGEFSKEEKDELPFLIDKSCDMSLSFGTIGINHTMSQFNN